MGLWQPTQEQVTDIYDAALQRERELAEAQDTCAEADDDEAPYEARMASTLRESRADFAAGRYYTSREDLATAVARMRTWSTISDMVHESASEE